jgi:serine/threonine-protein kinase
MGAVYLAQDLQLQRLVAIKVLPPELAVRPELRERFLRETRVAAGFSHPNIVAVHAVEEHPQLLCFVMGFIEGETLGQRVRRGGPLGSAEAVRMLQEVAWALSYAHGRGVVHRDIKPDNILIERATGRSLVTDFGIARSSSTGATNLTQVGEVVGTPQFMSPEQAAGEPLDGRSDLYSLGVVAFFAVTGRLPFEAPSAGAVMAMHLTQPPPRVASLRPDLPQPLCAAIDRCLEKDPAKRFENGEALAAALEVMRGSRREVSPAVRMFQLQANQGVRAFLIVLAMAAAFLENILRSRNDAGFILVIVLAATAMWGIFAGLVGRARYLLTLGHSFDEVRDGLGVILAERAEARAQELANARARKRDALRTRIMVAAIVLSIAGVAFVVSFMREKIGPDTYRVGFAGFVVLAMCAALLGVGIALLMMNPARSNGLDRQIVRLWRGGAGRAMFRLAGWRLDRELGAAATTSHGAGFAAPATPAAATPGAATPGTVIPDAARTDAAARIVQLQEEMRSLADRHREIASALADVSSEVRNAETDRGHTTP